MTSAEDRIKQALKALSRRKVLVGVPGDTRPTDKGKTINNAVLAYINELGDEELNIPPRPFLVPGVQDAKDQITKILTTGAARALSGDIGSVDQTLNAVGLVAQGAVKARMQNGPFTPLKPSTIYNRQHRTVPPPNKRTSPLIDTRDLFNHVTYVVSDK